MEKRIRGIEVSDAAAVREIYAPFVEDSPTSFELVLPDVAEMEQRIRELTTQYPWLVFEADRNVLGYAYASSHRARRAYQWSVEVSVYIHEKAQRRGVGRALYAALFDVLKQQGYASAYAGITLPNPSSVGLHESLGFASIGVFPRVGFKLGQWHDVAWLHLRLLEDLMPVHDPLPAKAILQDDRMAETFRLRAQAVRLD